MTLQRIVVTNDDGIDAPGLVLAERLAAELAHEVWTFAPATDQSGMAQALSMHEPLRVTEVGPRRFAVTGTPADCVMVALGSDRMDGARPDLVLSGVNWGANLSDSVMYSGTVGAALAAAHFELPAIALSQVFTRRSDIDFGPTERHARWVIERLWAQHARLGCCWNINFPMCQPEAIEGLRFVRQIGGSMQKPQMLERTDGRGLGYHWLSFQRDVDAIADPSSDVVAIRDQRVSVMPLQQERCHETRLARAGLDCPSEWLFA